MSSAENTQNIPPMPPKRKEKEVVAHTPTQTIIDMRILDEEGRTIQACYTDAFFVRAANAFDSLMEEHRDGECYCLNPEESLGRNPCSWCKVEAVLAKSQEGK